MLGAGGEVIEWVSEWVGGGVQKVLISFNNHEEACKMLCGKAGFEPRTFGTKAERYDHCAARPVGAGCKV